MFKRLRSTGAVVK